MYLRLKITAARNSPCVSTWYRKLDSNQRPSGYEPLALVSWAIAAYVRRAEARLAKNFL